MKLEMQQIMYECGVFRSYRGYAYFEKAVCMAYENPECLLAIIKEIYAPIAEEYNTTISSVEKDIRTIRDVLLRNDGKQILKKRGFIIYDDKLYPREMIEIFATYFRSKR